MLKSSNIFYGWIIVSISTLVFAIVRGVNDAFRSRLEIKFTLMP